VLEFWLKIYSSPYGKEIPAFIGLEDSLILDLMVTKLNPDFAKS
jgi:hypothetical protein